MTLPRTNVRHGIKNPENNKHSESAEICFRVRSYERQRGIVRKMLEGVEGVIAMSSPLDRLFTSRRRFGTFGFASLTVSVLFGSPMGCSAPQAPLSIHMYNPKTYQALTCSARDQRAGTDVSVLAGAVERCAQRLEAQGFVREK